VFPSAPYHTDSLSDWKKITLADLQMLSVGDRQWIDLDANKHVNGIWLSLEFEAAETHFGSHPLCLACSRSSSSFDARARSNSAIGGG
jgi:hypothetical protein